jgi:hypothetical protein
MIKNNVWPGSVIQVSGLICPNSILFMQKKLYKNRHYNTPGHAHELTFSCYKRIQFFNDTLTCEKFLEEVKAGREKFHFLLWA